MIGAISVDELLVDLRKEINKILVIWQIESYYCVLCCIIIMDLFHYLFQYM